MPGVLQVLEPPAVVWQAHVYLARGHSAAQVLLDSAVGVPARVVGVVGCATQGRVVARDVVPAPVEVVGHDVGPGQRRGDPGYVNVGDVAWSGGSRDGERVEAAIPGAENVEFLAQSLQ